MILYEACFATAVAATNMEGIYITLYKSLLFVTLVEGATSRKRTLEEGLGRSSVEQAYGKGWGPVRPRWGYGEAAVRRGDELSRWWHSTVRRLQNYPASPIGTP